jgi:PRC-barrel domain
VELACVASVVTFNSQQREALMADVLSGTPTKTSKHSLIASDRVEGTPVRSAKGEKIGSIERLMIDKKSGKVAYAVLSFGGFLGMGHKHFPIPWKSLDYDPNAEAYVVSVSEERLKDAPSYEDKKQFDWGDRSQEITLHNYYGAGPYWGI